MKRYIKLSLVFLIVFILVGCITKQSLENIEEIKIGLVETTENKNFICCYDDELKEIAVQNFKDANFGILLQNNFMMQMKFI